MENRYFIDPDESRNLIIIRTRFLGMMYREVTLMDPGVKGAQHMW